MQIKTKNSVPCQNPIRMEKLLKKLAEIQAPILLSDGHREWTPDQLMKHLKNSHLQMTVYMQSGMYIAQLNDQGFFSRILYRVVTQH